MYVVALQAFFHKQPDIVGGIIAGIQAEQERSACDQPGKPEHLGEESWRVFLAVLLPFPQLAGKQVSFRPDICKDRGIPVLAFVGSGNALLAAFFINERTDININRDIPVCKGGRLNAIFLEKAHVCHPQGVPQAVAYFIHPLAHGCF